MAAFADGIRVAESRRRAERMMLLLLQLQLVIYLLEQGTCIAKIQKKEIKRQGKRDGVERCI